MVLTHGRSRVVAALLQKASESKNFSVLVTEGRPEGSGRGDGQGQRVRKVVTTMPPPPEANAMCWCVVFQRGRHVCVFACTLHCIGYQAAARCAKAGIPATVVLDSAIGYMMERVSSPIG